ncbi:MAG: amidinotransferase [Flavobacteriia bacterium]|nr:amidinotransferase [Flavobacteriia bacterium]
MTTLLLIRPKHFGFNPETAESNSFQTSIADKDVHSRAVDEFNRMVHVLRLHAIPHFVINDTERPIKPDAIFPNNWFSTHRSGRIVIYPMEAENRRTERREDIINRLKSEFEFTQVIDYTSRELDNVFLEGTGSLVFDRIHRYALLSRSSRSNLSLAEEVCHELDYKLISFTAIDHEGIPVYHTNVLLCIGEKFIVWCPQMISDKSDRLSIEAYIEKTKRESIEISPAQVKSFAGNMLEVKNENGNNCLLMSSTARRSLSTDQIFALRKYCALLPIPIPTIEKIGGGSVRCMVAEIVN